MTLGHNTGSAQELTNFIERLEKLDGDKQAIAADVKVVNAELASAGFDLIFRKRRRCSTPICTRSGLSTEPPLSRFTKNAAVDKASLDSIVDYMEPAVPPSGGGHIDIVFGKSTWRLSRDMFGVVIRAEVTASAPERKPEVERLAKTYEPEPVPDVDEEGARQLGRDFANANRAVIDNPFPYGDARRARFDEGWREASGGDGMGPKGPGGPGKK